MSSTNAPFGLRPAYHPSGLDRAVTLADGIASAYNTAILKGQPVKLNSSGNIVVAAAGDAFQGAFAGVQWTDTTGRARVSNYWPANTAYTAGTCVAYYYNDPNIVYEIQAAGSTTTGLSACTLSTTLVGAGNSAQMLIRDLAPYPDNAWGDSYTIVRVTINESQFNASVLAV